MTGCADNCQWLSGEAQRGLSQLHEKFNHHPRRDGQNWGQHCVESLQFSLRALGASVALFVHAIFPFLFTDLSGNTINSLSSAINRKRGRRRPIPVTDHPLAQSVHEDS